MTNFFDYLIDLIAIATPFEIFQFIAILAIISTFPCLIRCFFRG